MHRVREIGRGDGGAARGDLRELLVVRDLPIDGDVLTRHAAPFQRFRGQSGPQHDAIGSGVARCHPSENGDSASFACALTRLAAGPDSTGHATIAPEAVRKRRRDHPGRTNSVVASTYASSLAAGGQGPWDAGSGARATSPCAVPQYGIVAEIGVDPTPAREHPEGCARA